MVEKRIYEIPAVSLDLNLQTIAETSLIHDGQHLELYYNMIFQDLSQGGIPFRLPNHLRPVATALGDKNIKSLMIILAPGLGKSQLLSICYPTWELGFDPSLTILGVSGGADLMMGFLQSSMGIIESNDFYKLLFPHTIPDKDRGWATTRGAFVKRPGAGIPDPSYAATGYQAKSITGKHAKLLILDDLHDKENCYSDDTEVLTKEGWKLFKDTNQDNLFATRNPITKKFEWQKASNFTCQDYDGELINFNSRGIDLLVTPNHRMVVAHRMSQKSEYILKAEELEHKSNRCLPVTSMWMGKSIDNFYLQSYNNAKSIAMNGDTYCAFMGMYLSEGYIKERSIVICQMEKSKGFIPFVELLTLIGGKHPLYDGTQLFLHSTLLAEYLLPFGHSLEKFVPQIIKDATPEQIQIFLDYYCLGDGTRNSIDELYTSSPKMADDLQELFQKVGYFASIKTKVHDQDKIICGKLVKAENCHDSYTISKHFSRFTHKPKHYISVRKHNRIKYQGKVYCVSVPNEVLYVRRNGYATWCGNTATTEQIDKVETFYYDTILGRRDPLGARIVMIGRRWQSDDLYGRLKESKDWVVMTLAAIRSTAQLYYDVRIPAGLSCVFNNFTPLKEVEDIKVVYGENQDPLGYCWNDPLMTSKYEEAMLNQKNMPSVFETVYQSNPEAAGTHIFQEQDFQDFVLPEDMQIGRSFDTVTNFMYEMQFDLVVQSWDTAFTADTDNDPSVGYTVGLKGCAKDHKAVGSDIPIEVPFHYDIYVLDENYQRLTMGDLKPAVVEYFQLWNPNYVLVEKSMPGIPIIHSLESDSIPVLGIVVQHTSKRSRAIMSPLKAGSAQGWAKQGRIFIPRNAPWANGLIGELKDFTGARNKRDDRVDALIQATNFAIDYGIQNRELPPGWRTDKEIDLRLQKWMIPEHPLAHLQYMAQNVQNPLYGLCGSCKNYDPAKSYCGLHKRTVIKLGTCYLYDADKSVTQIIDITGEPVKEK